MNRMKKVNQNRDTILLDLDGTLYAFPEGTFRRSRAYARIKLNAQHYVAKKLKITVQQAKNVLKSIEQSHGEEISIGLEERYDINRHDYFKAAWDIPAKKYITSPPKLRAVLIKIGRKYNMLLLSDAPKVWIDRVLHALSVADLFRNRIISGDGDERKNLGNSFNKMIKMYHLNPKKCIVVGDQEHTDIIPARALGMRTIFVHNNKTSDHANINIQSINELETALKQIEK